MKGAKLPRDFTMALLVSAVVLAISMIPRLFSPWFYYWDDMLQSFVPEWRHLGQRLLSGELPLLEPSAWMGGNPIAEAGYGVWNPLNLIGFVFAASVDHLPTVALVVATQYLIILAVGVYFLCREYGARPLPAALVAIAMPFSGFTLFYEATRWPGGLQAFAGVVVFWVFARRFAHRRSGPVPMMVTGFFVITFGNPYGALGMIVVLVGVAVELFMLRHGRRVLTLVWAGAVSGSAGVLVFLPLLLVSPVGWRRQSQIENNGFLVPSLGDLMGMSSPSYQPDVANWWGPIDASPSTYLAFFVLPLLPWLKWSSLRMRWRQVASVLVVGIVYLVFTIGPSNFGMFRWPLRFIEYAYVSFLVVFAILLSRGIARNRLRLRMIATAVTVLVGGYLAYAAFPGRWKWHALLAVGVFCGIALSIRLMMKRKESAAAALLIVGVAVSLTAQSWMFLRAHPAAPRDVPISAAVLERNGAELEGTTLIVSDPGVAVPPVVRDGDLVYGHMVSVAMPEKGINRYTGLGFEKFASALCMDYRGGVCPKALDRLWKEPEGADVPLVDALGIDTLVIADTFAEVSADELPDGWRIDRADDVRTVLVRTVDLPKIGTVSAASQHIEPLSADVSDDGLRERIHVRSGGGEVVLRRLAWPGYQVRVDGEIVETSVGPAGLLEFEVPAGDHTIDVAYHTPGLMPGAIVAALGAIAGVALVIYQRVGRKRTRASVPRHA